MKVHKPVGNPYQRCSTSVEISTKNKPELLEHIYKIDIDWPSLIADKAATGFDFYVWVHVLKSKSTFSLYYYWFKSKWHHAPYDWNIK